MRPRTRREGAASREVLKRWLFAVLGATGADARALRRHAGQDRLLVLNLHSVAPWSNPYGPSLHPDAFADLLAWLIPRSTPCLFGDLPAPSGRDPRRPLVLLSFDDGLADFTEHAMPVLADAGLRVNLNVIGAAMATGEPPWALRVVDRLGAAPVATVKRLRLAGLDARLEEDERHAKERFGAKLTNHLKGLDPVARAPALEILESALGDAEVERPTRMMSAADVAAARAAGHEIGSHSYCHESMEYLDDAAVLEDLERSRTVLASAGTPAPTVYAFPNGSHRPGQPELLRQAGIDHVLLVGERPSRPGASVHPRITLRGGSDGELRMRAAHGRVVAGH